MTKKRKELWWRRLDNAALIFPAALRKHWSNAFRISVSLTEEVDPAVLQSALEAVAPRFPSVCVRLRRGLFWYYLEELPEPPAVREDTYQPLIGMTRRDIRRSAIRVLYYRDRLAVEFFHSVTDGTGGMIFVKTLAAEYLRQRFGAAIPAECGILDIGAAPDREEFEDSFQKYAGHVRGPRDDRNVYRLQGTPEPDRFLHVTCGILDSRKLQTEAKRCGVTVTGYLTAVLLEAILQIQTEEIRDIRKRKPVKIQIPVNLRKLYPSRTMRNFVAVANVGVDPRLGEYSFDELLSQVYHQMQLTINPKIMATVFTPNVKDEALPLLKVVPLFLKNLVMRAVYDRVGESVSCLSLSNLGNVELPEEMAAFVTRVEFVLGSQASSPYNASATSWGGKTFLNIVRNSREPKLEEKVFTALVKRGFAVRIETNDPEEEG